MKKISDRKQTTGKGRQIAFKIISIFLPMVLLLCVELILRIADYGENFRVFTQVPEEAYEQYLRVNPEIGKKYFMKFGHTTPPNDIFLKEKPENTFRVFVMGSSVVYGFPYDRNLMFSRILHQQLEDAYPSKNMEVVNTSVTAVNTYTLRDFTGEILKQDPDAILIYEGHNEFYGALGSGSSEGVGNSSFVIRLHLRMMHLKIYQMLQNAISGLGSALASRNDSSDQPETLMKRMVEDNAIAYGSDQYNRTMATFEKNLAYMIASARNKNVPVFLSELVSNVGGMEPFISIDEVDQPRADKIFTQAQQAEIDGQFDKARELYYKAKDLDGLRFRASEQANRIVRELAEIEGVFLVPMQGVFEAGASNKIIGNTLMTEHVHPNVEGIFLMANTFFESLTRSGITDENALNTKPIEYYRKNWGYTRLDTLLAHHRIQSLMSQWPFVSEGENAGSYIETFRSQSFSDSITFAVMRRADLSLAEARLDMAKKLQEAGRIESAYYEYEALIRTNPYRASNYRDAAQCLTLLGDLPLAKKYFQKSLQYEDSWFAHFRLGEICLMMGDVERATEYLDKANVQAPAGYKANVLGKLLIALVYDENQARAAVVADELQKMNARQFLRVPGKIYAFNNYIPFQTKAEVEQAIGLLSNNEPREAISVLEPSLLEYDSHMARKLLADAYMQVSDYSKASHYFNSVHELFRFDAEFLYSFTSAELRNENKPAAARIWQQLQNVDPEYPDKENLSEQL